MVLMCSVAAADHFGHMIKVVFARLPCCCLISALWLSPLSHVDDFVSIKLSILCTHLSVIYLCLYICINSLLAILSDGFYPSCISLIATNLVS